MGYKLAADLIVVIHFAWIVFMLWGVALTAGSVIGLCVFGGASPRCTRFMDRWIFRTVHLGGILFVGLLAGLGKYCPLTIWEYNLRRAADPYLAYPGSFIVQWIQRLVYPDVHPLMIVIPTIFIALFTLLAYLLCPPIQIRRFLHREKR